MLIGGAALQEVDDSPSASECTAMSCVPSARLQEQGIDVWRDETGSSLVGPMSDSADETMALAVEASSAVVICVSQKYLFSCAPLHYIHCSSSCIQVQGVAAKRLRELGPACLPFASMRLWSENASLTRCQLRSATGEEGSIEAGLRDDARGVRWRGCNCSEMTQSSN
jgi:hypothetical protein